MTYSKKPVEVKDNGDDTFYIEGVRYSGDFFRAFAVPIPGRLYEIVKDQAGAVTVISYTPEGVENWLRKQEAEPGGKEPAKGERDHDNCI